MSTVVPLLKPKKPAEDSTSYRPVSLLCPAVKILERLILPTLTKHLPIPAHQHGFRAKHSTISALDEFNQQISQGFNKRKPANRTVLLMIDLSKAFDMVSNEKLLRDLNRSTLPESIKRWFNSYLHGRQSRVRFRNTTSKARNVKTGVPQGAVTSPVLFNYYLAMLPLPPSGVYVVQYADDISVYTTGTNIEDMAEQINKYISLVLDFLKERELEVSPTKSSVTLFTPDTKEAMIHPNVEMEGIKVDLDKTPKLLGVTFDTMYTFGHHIRETIKKTKSKVNLLKSLAGSAWGQDKETLIITYKAVARSTLEYGTPIWSPIISDTNWSRLQSVQNQGLRVATGCLLMTSQEHLHQECKMLPVRRHCTLLTKQHTAACFPDNHPGHKLLDLPAPQRKLKPTHLIYKEEVADKFRSMTLKSVVTALHTSAVKETISSYLPNRVLQRAPPPISKEEKGLPRSTRSELARLRSGFSRKLNSYLNRIDESVPDSCPDCSSSTHTTDHLFNCPANETELSTSSLWTDPIKAAMFLNLLPVESDEKNIDPG